MQWRACIILGLLYVQPGVQGVSLFNFWSHILPGSQKGVEQNSVSASAEDYSNETIPTTASLADFSSEESPKITELLNPMTWFKKTKKTNTFEINAELGTVRAILLSDF